jgi:uncharacterized membrane protein YjgN (DUF898 family)
MNLLAKAHTNDRGTCLRSGRISIRGSFIMSAFTADASLSLSQTSTLPMTPPDARLHFAGSRSDYWRLMIRGAALQAITLGIYRFWLHTDMRRFLWASTQVESDNFEYTGTAVELLLGFLIAIGILIPIYGLLFVASLELGVISGLSGIVGFVVLACFGQYAAYRARRYRLTRTVLRGLRFHQTGSPVLYALRAVLWWFVTVWTFGLAYPWMEASLERYKMRNTFYGDIGGRFDGAGWRLFGRGILLWLLIVVPVVAAFAYALSIIDWSTLRHALTLGTAAMGAALQNDKSVVAATALMGIALSWLTFAVILFYPALQAIVMRWWLAGLRLGGTAAASDLRKRRFYGAYLRYLLYVFLFTIVYAVLAGIVMGIGYYGLSGVIDWKVSSPVRDGVAGAAGIVAYVIYILAVSTIYQVVVKMRLWQVAVDSIALTGFAALDHAHATAATSSAVGEGLADALGGGGI